MILDIAVLRGEEQSHLQSCDSCRKQLGWMQMAAAEADLEDPPQLVMDKVIQASRNRSRLKQLRNVISALLTFDSLKLAPVGVRSEATTSRQMTFESDGIEIGIWLRPSSDGKMMLSGQVLGKSSGPIEDTTAYVDLVIEGDHVKSTPLNAWGEFMFIDLAQTPCSLQVYFSDRVVKVPSVPGISSDNI